MNSFLGAILSPVASPVTKRGVSSTPSPSTGQRDGVSGLTPRTTPSKTPDASKVKMIQNRMPFQESDRTPGGGYAGGTTKWNSSSDSLLDREICHVVDELVLSMDEFRNSTNLKRILSEIVDESIMSVLGHIWVRQSVRTRLDCFMKMLVAVMCCPRFSTVLGVGLGVGAWNGPSRVGSPGGSLIGSSSPATSGTSGSPLTTPIKPQPDSELCAFKSVLVTAFSLFIAVEQSLYHNGDDDSYDTHRADLAVALLRLRASSLIPLITTVSEHCPPILETMACHILSVKALAPAIIRCQGQVMGKIRNVISDESNEFNENEVFEFIHMVFLDYFVWLRKHKEDLTRSCRSIEIVASVDPSIRAWLKGEEYSSPQHIIHTYRSKYKSSLTQMPIPLHPFQVKDLNQAKKDIQRESIELNSVVLAGGDEHVSANLGAIKAAIHEALCKASSGYLSMASQSPPLHEAAGKSDSDAPLAAKSGQADESVDTLPTEPSSSWHHEMLDLLYHHALIAVSRTTAGGDAFFIVEDLFGGDGLVICPAATSSSDQDQPSYRTKISITTAGIKIVLHERYKLFAEGALDRPLVCFRCSTTTLIVLEKQLGTNATSARHLEFYHRLMTSPESVCYRAMSVEPYL
jgi:hypothetical protein